MAFFVAAARVATRDVLPSVAVSAAGLCRDTRGMISDERNGGNETNQSQWRDESDDNESSWEAPLMICDR